jgi:bifunctional DNA-binding transcriptional regulator/antitoxin component of YhaV-PrlF toxin-antitoxin module
MVSLMKTAKITAGGQVSIPAEVRRRWATNRVVLEDLGDSLVVRPLPDDPVTALRGSLKGRLRVTTDELRRQARADEAAAERRKWGR